MSPYRNQANILEIFYRELTKFLSIVCLVFGF